MHEIEGEEEEGMIMRVASDQVRRHIRTI